MRGRILVGVLAWMGCLAAGRADAEPTPRGNPLRRAANATTARAVLPAPGAAAPTSAAPASAAPASAAPTSTAPTSEFPAAPSPLPGLPPASAIADVIATDQPAEPDGDATIATDGAALPNRTEATAQPTAASDAVQPQGLVRQLPAPREAKQMKDIAAPPKALPTAQAAVAMEAADRAAKATGIVAFEPVAGPPTAEQVGLTSERLALQPRPPLDSTFEVIDESGTLEVMLRRSKLLRTKVDIYRTAVVDPRVCNVIQFTPREVSIIGQAQGATHVTFWFQDGQHQPLTYLVRVVPDPEVQQRREEQYEILEEILLELFPDSKVRLIPVTNKLIVRGEAKGAEEAAQILNIIRAQVYGNGTGGGGGFGQGGYGYGIAQGLAAEPLVDQQDASGPLPPSQVINMLRVPGEHQVALKVKIAELNRSAARRFGIDADLNLSRNANVHFIVQSMLNAASGSTAVMTGQFGNATAPLDHGLHYLESEGVVRILSEPTLVTLTGRAATFVAGGEFAVPTTVGVGGAAAVTTDFRSFGAILTFLPVVLDKDRIRLQIAPEFSKIDNNNTVNDVPGLQTRAVTTTVEMREGQTLVVAGLLEDSMQGSHAGNIPFFRRILGLRELSRNETELVILVTPELVHAMEPEEVPPLPGFDVTEPTNREFFFGGHLEGLPTREYRSTIWPRLKRRYRSDSDAMIAGPFGHGN